MCGIAGYYQLKGNRPPDRDLLTQMVIMLRHRGPDEFGAYFDNRCALGQARLSIIDLSSGSQPLCNEDGTLWITFNGEIFNYKELRPMLEQHGHRFRTHSDTEVIIHAYEQFGKDCLKHFNGQFAFAIYDNNKQTIFMARDQMGIRPLFYTVFDGRLYFASEIKSIFCDRRIPRRLDVLGLDEIFTWWTTAPPRTAFEGINELEAGSYLEIKNGTIQTAKYWTMDYPESYDDVRKTESWAEELHALLVDAVRLQLRADVPVGAYLSGGLDSSAITALIKYFTNTPVETFSIAFHDKTFDESDYQNQMAHYLGTNHQQIRCDYHDIAENFPHVIWHTERPIVRTAPTPLYLLSRLVRQSNFKVVLTGEGSDEIFGGYDLFKEALIRNFWSHNPDSTWRPSLLKRLYPTLPLTPGRARFYLETFYKTDLSNTELYYYSHIPRISTTTRIKGFFTEDVKSQIGSYNSLGVFGKNLPTGFARWHILARAQFLEARSLLAGYLLSSQGDRVCAANSIEGRYPFLDYRVVEFASKIPPRLKISGLKEKFILKKSMAKELPKNILERVKQPYMAPDSNCFFAPNSPEYIQERLSEAGLNDVGIFNPVMVAKLREKCAKLSHAHLSFKDNMSFIGILSTQILHQQYINNFRPPASSSEPTSFRVWQDHSS
jgi:asparagine synthase (glutamine-hydrolysing)